MRVCAAHDRRRAPSGRSTPTCAPRVATARWCARSPRHDGYYRRWAATWEFQALLKARPAAGDLDLGAAFVELVAPLVWSAADRDGLRRPRPGDASAGRGQRAASRRRPPAQARPRRAARRRVLGAAAAAGPRAQRRAAAQPDDAARRWRRSPPAGTSAARTPPTLAVAYTLPADARAPHPAAPAPPQPRRSRGRGRPASDRPVDGHAQRPGGRADEPVAAPPQRGAPPAREAVLPPAAGRGGPARRRRRPAYPGRGGAAAAGPRLHRPRRGAAQPGGAHLRRQPPRRDPAHPAAGDARLVRRVAGPGRWPARLPSRQRRAGLDAVVPAPAPGRVGRRRADGARARLQPVRRRPAAARAGGGADARRRRAS